MVSLDNNKNTEISAMRQKISRFVESSRFTLFITILILINAVTLGFETSGFGDKYRTMFDLIDIVVISVFVIELVLKMFAYRFQFFRSGWNIFDFLIVAISLVPAAGPLSVLRTFRVFRVLRLMSVVPQMRRIITALLSAIPGMASILAVLFILFYVFSVLATQIFGAHESEEMQRLFGTIPSSMYTLFCVMTLEGWVDGVANPTMVHFPWAGLFFIPFIIMTSFAVLNLFIGIIVDAMQHPQEEARKEDREEIQEIVESDTAVILRKLDFIQEELEVLKNGKEKT